MTLRSRIAITAAAAVTLAFVIAAGGLYATTARALRGEVDRSLRTIATDLASGRPRALPRALGGVRAGALGGPGGFVQVVDRDGQVLGPRRPRLPAGEAEAAVASGRGDAFFRTVEVDGRAVRVLTVPVIDGIAAQVARPLDEVEASLAALRTRLALGGAAGVLLAIGLGVLVARGAVQPVERLTALAEDVAATGDLTRRIALPGGPDDRDGDELHRLARTFNTMLANLEQARLAQQQLVADASHELRTPLTSLRTNIEVLTLDAAPSDCDTPPLAPADRRRLLADLTVQLDEFGRLVGALVELARGAQPVRAPTPVRLDEVVEAATDRARSFAGPDQVILLDATPVTVHGEVDRLDRAVANLLDNAVKYGGGAPIDVTVSTGPPAEAVVTVRDRGPGLAAEHRAHVFDRFYRAPETRDVRGSGLGLSIVAQVVEAHGGRVGLAPADGGGTIATIRLPAV